MRDQETIEREAEKLAEIGGVRWTKNGMDRVYFDSLAHRIGLHIYKRTLNGKPIARRAVSRILGTLRDTKIHYDLNTGKLMYYPIDEYADMAYAAVLAEVKEALK